MKQREEAVSKLAAKNWPRTLNSLRTIRFEVWPRKSCIGYFWRSNDFAFSSASSRLSTGAKGLYGEMCFPFERDKAIQSHQRSSALTPLVVCSASGKV